MSEGWFSRANWFGLAAGVLMVALPFLGPWWRLVVGSEAAVVELSPFSVRVALLDKPLEVPTLVSYVVLAARLAVWAGGAAVLAASALPKRWWSRQLMRFGATKVLWELVGLVGLILALGLVANELLVRWLPGLSLPYLTGAASSSIEMEGGRITFPIEMALTPIFGLAAVASGLGIAARVFHRRFLPKS